MTYKEMGDLNKQLADVLKITTTALGTCGSGQHDEVLLNSYLIYKQMKHGTINPLLVKLMEANDGT